MKFKLDKRSYFVGMAFGILATALGIEAVARNDYDEAFRAGMAKGMKKCSEPSKLERAAKWWSRP